MLSVLRSRDLDFGSAAAALPYLEGTATRHFTVPLQNLRIDCQGTLSHPGKAPIGDLQRVPLTDVALAHVDALAGIPRSYAARIEPDLHAHSINRLLKEQLGAATADGLRREHPSRLRALPGWSCPRTGRTMRSRRITNLL